MTTPSTAPVRRWIVRITIGSFSLAALLGIVALLSGGEFGETEGRILLTTLLVGVVSIAVLCYLTTAGRRSQPVGVIGGAIVLVPLVTGLLLIWAGSDGSSDALVKTFAIGGIVAATVAQICLLLAPEGRGASLARRMLTATIGLAALLAVLTSLLVLGVHPGDDGFYRGVGVVAILDVLGTVVGAALMKFGPGGTSDDREAAIDLPPDLEARLARHTGVTGQSREEVVLAAVDRYLTEVDAGPAEATAESPEALRTT